MSEKSKTIYITTTLPYVNAEPHIGFALEILQADATARWYRSKGDEVFFSTGTDEHGQKIWDASQKAGENVLDYVDRYAGKFENLKKALDLSNDTFIRTTDKRHINAAQKIWEKCKAKGDIYEREFEGLYCVGCERFLAQRDLENGDCVIHRTRPELIKEKNWFFKFSNYADKLIDYLSNSKSVIPDWRREEAINFVKEGLEDFSISRDKNRLSWGVPVPGDETQIMYVWFDALTNYISTLGWPEEGGDFKKYWQDGYTIQFAGKDQVRFQSLMWQAMLMSAELKNTDTVFYHGFINSGGQKMSKSLGNVISPFELVDKYGTDATRYLLLRHVHSTEDTDVTWEKLDEWYEAGLANGLGNLVSRIMKLAEDNLTSSIASSLQITDKSMEISRSMSEFRFDLAMESVWSKISLIDKDIQEKKPWESKDKEVIGELVRTLDEVGRLLFPFMPDTSRVILKSIEANKKPAILFPRKV